jgi:hypothetical protein
MGLEKDLPPGEQISACWRPFIEHLVSSALSAKAVRRHTDNLWVLGGEIVCDLHYDPSLSWPWTGFAANSTASSRSLSPVSPMFPTDFPDETKRLQC